MGKIELSHGVPFVSFSTNDGHLFCLAANNELEVNVLSLNALDLGYSITRTSYGMVYDSYLKVQQENVIDYKEIKKENFSSIEDFNEFILQNLSQDSYIILDLDVSKISLYSFSHNGTIHSPLVIGIDPRTKKILLGDFFDFKHYETKWVSLEEVYVAYKVIQDYVTSFAQDGYDDWIRMTSLIHHKFFKNEINIQLVLDSIKNYLEPQKVQFSSKQVSSFHLVSHRIQGINEPIEETELLQVGSGISIYGFLKEHIEAEFDRSEYRVVQSATILEAHYKILDRCMNFINDNLKLSFEFRKNLEMLKTYSTQLKVICLKKFMRPDSKGSIEDCIILINKMKEVELYLLSELYMNLKTNQRGEVNL